MAEHGTAQTRAAAGDNKTLAGIRLFGGFAQEILRVDMNRIWRSAPDRGGRIFIRAQEIAHVYQQPKVVMCHRVHQQFDPIGVLTECAVIFHRGFDPLFRRVGGHCPAALGQPRQYAGKPTVSAGAGEAEGGVMPENFSAEYGGHIHFSAQARSLGCQIAVAAAQQVGPYRVSGDFDAAARRLVVQLGA